MSSDQPLDVPHDRYYERERHLWLQRDAKSGRVRVGIDAIGLESLGELAYVTLCAVGTTVARGEPVGSLEAAKMTSAVVAPVGGTVVARNDAVLRDPLLANEDPYGRGWLFELEPAAWDEEAAGLVFGEAVAAWAADRIERLREETSADR
jgi:glycine cleavage system H protein